MSSNRLSFETLTVERIAGVLTVWLNRPELRNAINLQMCDELCTLFEQLRFDGELDLVIIRGRGPAFCAGVDLKEFRAQSLDWMSKRRHRGLDAYLAVEGCPAPTLSVVHGAAVGGGSELATACDFIYATSDASFQWPEASRGGVGATQRLPRIVGRSLARELLFTGRRLAAPQANSVGLVNRVFSEDKLQEGLDELIREIAGASRGCIRLIKRAMDNGECCDRPTAISIERQAIEHSLHAFQRTEVGRQSLR